ncbi:hypothetical protein HDU79_008709 [Rhizoclosmatium sp. JEL0117]|nr:hypothetical protein HDU79_008709 [Rhizoclosmatium sp. JEL0117]
MSELDTLFATSFSTASLDTSTHSRLAKTLLNSLKNSDSSSSSSSSKSEWRVALWRCVLAFTATKRVAKDAAAKTLRFLDALVKAADAVSVSVASKKDVVLVDKNALVLFLLKKLSKGAHAKQAHVRFRVCQCLFLLLNHVQEIDDDLHDTLRTILMQRARDKDVHVRVQASMALSRFQGPPEDIDTQVVDVLIDLMTGDASSEVRKTILWNIDLTATSLIPLLQRATDVDVGVRRMVYQKFAASVPDMHNLPPEVPIALLTVGLKDRDAGVRKKCRGLLCDVWYKGYQGTLLEFLADLNVRSVAAQEALVALVEAGLVKTDFVTDDMWGDALSIEFVFFASVYARCLDDQKEEDKLLDFLPSLSTLSNLLSKFGALIVNPPTNDESQIKALEFVLSRLLQLTECHDFSDEVGRRGVSLCLSKLLVCEDLPTENLQYIIKILRKMEHAESDVLLIVADAVSGIVEASDDAELEDGVDPLMHKLLIQMQCLEIIRALFEQILKPPGKDSSFLVLLHRFVIPSVRSNNALLRQTGIHCLGLACYVDRTLSLENANLFLHAFQVEELDGKKLVLRILFDLIMIHGVTVVDVNAVVMFILACLQHEDPGLLTLAAEGATKLLMMKFIENEQILEALLVLYFHPHTAGQHRLRQCLSCFFPMYALSSAENQEILATTVVAAFTNLTLEYEESGQGLSPGDIAAQMGEWTDYRRLVTFENGEEHATGCVHGVVAVSLLEAMLREPDIQKEGTKMLNILYIDATVSEDVRKRILKLADDVQPMLVVDPVSLKGLKRFTAKIQDGKKKSDDGEESEESD